MAARKWPESQYRRNERPRERLMKVPGTSPGHLSDAEVRSRFSNRPSTEERERDRDNERERKKRKKRKKAGSGLGGEERESRKEDDTR